MTYSPPSKRPPLAPGPPSSSRGADATPAPPSSRRFPEAPVGPPSSTRTSAPSSPGLPPSKRPSGDVLEPLLALLTRYVSLPTAQSVLSLTRRRTGIHTPGLDRAQLREMLEPIERGLRLFIVDPKQAADCRHGLEALCSAQPAAPAPEAVTFEVRVEDDVARVRREARDFAAARGFSLVGQTRLTTAVSELARNIVQYAGTGQIELRALSTTLGLEIVARDRGPGIPNLDQIMAGNYRSRLGMGLGLQGVKKLADRFDVQTGTGRGTTVTFTMKVI